MRLRTDLMNAGSAFLQPLRDSEFVSAIRHRSAIPGGTCEFDLPDYYFWLTQPDEARMRTFNQWLGLLRPLCDAIAELLWLTRQNGRGRQEIAQGGAFNITFDRDNPLQLLRISLPDRGRPVPGDQRQSSPLQHPLSHLERPDDPSDTGAGGRAVRAQLLHLNRCTRSSLR